MTLKEIMNSPLDQFQMSTTEGDADDTTYNVSFGRGERDSIVVNITAYQEPVDYLMFSLGVTNDMIRACVGSDKLPETLIISLLDFQRLGDHGRLTYLATGQGDQDKVFTGVKLAVEQYIRDNPSVQGFHFTAHGKSRIRLYRTLSSIFCRTWPGNRSMKETHEDKVDFVVLKDNTK